MFINKYIYKTILNANFKEKKDRFFICFFQNYDCIHILGSLSNCTKSYPLFQLKKITTKSFVLLQFWLRTTNNLRTYVQIMITLLALCKTLFQRYSVFMLFRSRIAITYFNVICEGTRTKKHLLILLKERRIKGTMILPPPVILYVSSP